MKERISHCSLDVHRLQLGYYVDTSTGSCLSPSCADARWYSGYRIVQLIGLSLKLFSELSYKLKFSLADVSLCVFNYKVFVNRCNYFGRP